MNHYTARVAGTRPRRTQTTRSRNHIPWYENHPGLTIYGTAVLALLGAFAVIIGFGLA